MNKLIQYKWFKNRWMPFCLLFSLLVLGFQAAGQVHPEQPPRPIDVFLKLEGVTLAQPLRFGAFVVAAGSGGSLTVGHSGSRSYTGNFIPVGSTANVSPALFIVEAEPGTHIRILNGTTYTLSGTPSGSLSLQLGEPSMGYSFITRDKYTYVYIGGTLTENFEGISPLPGEYFGTFQVTFIQE